MSKKSMAVSPNPKYAKLKLGIAPDSWGVWFPEDDQQIAPLTTLDEMAEAGFEYLETGPFGYFPTDPDELRRETESRGLTVVACTQGGAVHYKDELVKTEEAARKNAATASALGAKHLVYLPASTIDTKTMKHVDDPVLSPEVWNDYMRGLEHIGKILKNEYDMRLEVHSHADTHIDTPEDIDRFMNDTDPDLVSFCLDTGHVVYGQGDPLKIIENYPDRIGFVHIKAMDPDIVKEGKEKGWPFAEAVAHGVSVTPPAGQPDMAKLVDALADLDKELFVIIEQDLYPVDPAFPLPNAIQTRKFLAECNLGSYDE